MRIYLEFQLCSLIALQQAKPFKELPLTHSIQVYDNPYVRRRTDQSFGRSLKVQDDDAGSLMYQDKELV
jgi:hypothetical protein